MHTQGHEFTRSVHDMAEGTRLKVYGMSFVNVNKKKNKKEAGVDVSGLCWEYVGSCR